MVSRHDEGAADVTVLDQRLSVFQVKFPGDLNGCIPGGVRHGDDNVDLEVLLFDLFGKESAQVHPTVVDIDVIDEGVGPGKIDPFEETGRMGTAGELFGIELLLLVDKNDLAGLDILDRGEIHDVEADGFRSKRIGGEESVMAFAVDKRLDPVRVSESDHALFCDIAHHRIAALDFLEHAVHCFKDMVRFEFVYLLVRQFLGEDVEDDFHIVAGVDQPLVFIEKTLFEFVVVDDIPVVGHDDAERRIDEKRLGIVSSSAADRRITGVADAGMAFKTLKMLGCEDIPNQSVSLFGKKAAVIGDDAGRILAPMLNSQETLVEVFDGLVISENPNNATHL